jgi:hypothetical protein
MGSACDWVAWLGVSLDLWFVGVCPWYGTCFWSLLLHSDDVSFEQALGVVLVVEMVDGIVGFVVHLVVGAGYDQAAMSESQRVFG